MCSITIDIDKCESISTEANVTSVPCFHIYRSGDLLKSWGGSDADKMRSMVNEFMNLKKEK